MSLQIPASINIKNIFLLIQEILSNQKTKSKKHDRALGLAIVQNLNDMYQKGLDQVAEKSKELKAKLSEEYEEVKKSLNSTGGWLLGGLAIAGTILGFLAGGPLGAAAGAAFGSGVGGQAILIDHLNSNGKTFFESKKEINPLKLQEKELSMKTISSDLEIAQVKTDMKKGEISRKMQEREMEEQNLISIENTIAALLKKLSETLNMMGRG